MNLTRRVLYGAALGALTVLLVHPASRNTLVTPFFAWGSSPTVTHSRWSLGGMSTLPQPRTVLDASLWMEAGAKGVGMRDRLTKEDLRKLIMLAEKASKEDPDNAYWNQMRAVFLFDMGRKEEALQAWLKSGRATRWDSYQSQRVTEVHESLISRYGGENAWQWLAVHQLRSLDPSRQIESYGRTVTKTASIDDAQGLRIRYATLMNGRLLRDGAKSLAVGESGANLVEVASHPADLGRHATPRRLLVARTLLINELNVKGLSEEAEKANKAFLMNDTWTALAPRKVARASLEKFSVIALLTGTLPGGLLMVSLLGLSIWGLSEFLKRKPRLQALMEPPLAPAMGIALSVLIYYVTKLPLAAVAVASCFGFLSFTPLRERSNPSESLGPLFRLTIVVLGLVVAALCLMFIIGSSTPGNHILPILEVPSEYYGGSTVFLALAVIVMALLLLVAPSWALVQRLPTPMVVIIAIRQFGQSMFVFCLAASLIAAPFAVFMDLQAGAELQKIVSNEPIYHLYNAP